MRELRLHRVITDFPWKTLQNLTVARLQSCFPPDVITRLPNFFESAPLLYIINLKQPIRGPSDTPPERIVPLRHLKIFTIEGNPPHSILLRHLHIPVGALLTSRFCSCGRESPLLGHLPKKMPQFRQPLSYHHCQSLLRSGAEVRTAQRTKWESPHAGRLDRLGDNQILRSLSRSMLSEIQRLTISGYEDVTSDNVEGCPIFQTPSSTNNLWTLTLIDCNIQPFTRALDPEQIHPISYYAPMEDFVFHTKSLYHFPVRHPVDMARN